MKWANNLLSTLGIAAVTTAAGCTHPLLECRDGRLSMPTQSASSAREVATFVQKNPDLAVESPFLKEANGKKVRDFKDIDPYFTDACYMRLVKVNGSVMEIIYEDRPYFGRKLTMSVHASPSKPGIVFYDDYVDGIKRTTDIPVSGVYHPGFSMGPVSREGWQEARQSFDFVSELPSTQIQATNVGTGGIYYQGNLWQQSPVKVHEYDAQYRKTLDIILKSGLLTKPGANIRLKGRNNAYGADIFEIKKGSDANLWTHEREKLLRPLLE